MAKKLATISQNFVQHEKIDVHDLAEKPCIISFARGPYKSPEYPDTSYIVVTVLISETAEERDVFLGYQSQGQRANLIEAYRADPDETYGPVKLVPIDVGKKDPFWKFVDLEEDPV
jgi:hypothetical protein